MLQNVIDKISRLRAAISEVIRGREDTINLVLTGLFADGHVLLEDYPGSGKTTLAKTLGALINCSEDMTAPNIVPFRRIQFTPDLLPSDVLGVTVFEPKSSSFYFRQGPLFAHIVLADEINRTGPKVQAAFLECMAERQITMDNVTHKLDRLFFVIGTQNPLDMTGTYPLPLVQLDRFLLRIPMQYVSSKVELEILKDIDNINKIAASITPVMSRTEVIQAQDLATTVHIAEPLLRAIVGIVQATRGNPLLQFGASTRSAIMLKRALSSWALVSGRDYATEDDLKILAPHVLLHRLRFHQGAGNASQALEVLMKPHIEDLVRSSW